jgi:hypothetical protein
VVLGDQGFRQFNPMCLDPLERAGFVQTDESAVAHDVHDQDCRELAILARSGHDCVREIPSEDS